MTNNKRTKKEMFYEIIEVLQTYGTTEQVETVEHEIELLNRKQARQEKPNEENQQLMNLVCTYYEENPKARLTCSELTKIIATRAGVEEISLPKMSAIMTKICGTVKEPKLDAPVVRVKDKKATFFVKA